MSETGAVADSGSSDESDTRKVSRRRLSILPAGPGRGGNSGGAGDDGGGIEGATASFTDFIVVENPETMHAGRGAGIFVCAAVTLCDAKRAKAKKRRAKQFDGPQTGGQNALKEV